MNTQAHTEFYREALADLDALEKKRTELLAVVRYHAEKAGIREENREQPIPEKTHTTGDRPFAELTHKEVAEFVLRKAGRPMSTTEITDQIIKAGYPCKDKAVFRNSLFARMSKAPDTFKRVGRGVWAIIPTNWREFELPSVEELCRTDEEEPVGAAGVGSTRHANGRV